MSAKPGKKRSGQASQKSETQTAAEPVLAASAPSAGAVGATADQSVAWIDSADPKKRMWGKIVLVAVWIYVAALWLLALDQTFNWGIFGPKITPLP